MDGSFTVSPAMRNFSRPLAPQVVTGELGPQRPPRSPLRSVTSQPLGVTTPTTRQHRRRSRSIGAMMAPATPTFDLQSPASISARKRTFSSGAMVSLLHNFTLTPRADRPVALQQQPQQPRQESWIADDDSRRSSPSSPSSVLPAEFVARGGPSVRDSLITTESSSSSLYPETFEDEHDHLPRIASYHEPVLTDGFDVDNVSYRLDLLVKNHYFLPPAHAKPSPHELASLLPRTPPPPLKKAPLLSPNNFRDLFRKSPSKSAAVPAVQKSPLPVHARARPHPPAQSIAVLREQLDDLELAMVEAEKHRLRERTPVPVLASLDDIDPTNEVDLPPHMLAWRQPTPTSPVLSEDEKWRRDLLEQAVGFSLSPSTIRTRTTERRSAEDKPRQRRQQRSTSPHRRRPRTAEPPPVPAASRATDTRSLRSITSPVSPNALIGSPIISENSYFSSLPRMRPAAPTPSRAIDFHGQDSPETERIPPVPQFPDPQKLANLSQTIDNFMDAVNDQYLVDSPVVHTPLSPPPPRRTPTGSVMSSGRSRGNSKASSLPLSPSAHSRTSSAQTGDSTMGSTPGPPPFIAQIEDPSGTRAPLSLPTMESLVTATSGSIYSNEDEVPDAGPPGGMAWSPSQNQWHPHHDLPMGMSTLDARPRAVRSPSFESNDTHRPSLALSMNPSRPSFDSSFSPRPSFEVASAATSVGRPSMDGGVSMRPSLTISIGGRAGSVHSLHSDAFGNRSRVNSRHPSYHPRNDDTLSVRSGKESIATAHNDRASVRSGRSTASNAYDGSGSTTPAPLSPLRVQPVPAPGSAGPAFFDEVQDRYQQSGSSDTESSSDGEDMRIIHLGAPPVPFSMTTSHDSSSRGNSPLPSPVFPTSSVTSLSGSTRMAWYAPVSNVATPADSQQQLSKGLHGKNKGLAMLQRAQAGSAVSLGAPPSVVSVHSVGSDEPHPVPAVLDTRARAMSAGRNDVADKRLDDMLVAHMEEERDRMKRIASELGAQSRNRD